MMDRIEEVTGRKLPVTALFEDATIAHLAAMAGLPTFGWHSSTKTGADTPTPVVPPTHGVVVFDGRVFGPILPRSLQDGCRRLAALLGVPMLQVLMHHDRAHGWRFVNATGTVDFQIGGRPLVSALASVLGGNVGA